MRRFGEPYVKGRKYVRRPGAYAIISDGRDLLVTLQDADELELQLPGGGIDPGETPVQALHREVMEETGHKVANLRRVGGYQRYTYMAEYSMWAHKICHIYQCSPALNVCDSLEEGHENIWMQPLDAMKYLTNGGDRHYVGQLIRLGLL